MQNMHKSTHDRPLTGVHWPIHRGWCRGSGTKGGTLYAKQNPTRPKSISGLGLKNKRRNEVISLRAVEQLYYYNS